MKLVLIPRSTLKFKSVPQLPGAVLGTNPIVVTAGGLTYTVSLNLVTLVTSLNAYYAPISQLRERLTASRTYYVRTDGNDSNTGLIDSAGGAFRTIQSAVNALALLDANQQSIIIQVRSGSYNEDVFLKPILGGSPNGAIILRGDTTTPSNVVINSTANCIFALGSITNDWLVEGFKFISGIYGVHGHANAWIRVGKVEFGACGTAHVIADYLGTVELQGAYTISGNSTYHAYAFCGGFILNAIVPATLTGTPAFSGSFAAAINRSYIEWNGGTFLGGSATGTRYLVNANSVINTAGAGANFFPGNVAGVAGTGGIYA